MYAFGMSVSKRQKVTAQPDSEPRPAALERSRRNKQQTKKRQVIFVAHSRWSSRGFADGSPSVLFAEPLVAAITQEAHRQSHDAVRYPDRRLIEPRSAVPIVGGDAP